MSESYYCVECGWTWPLSGDLPVGAECDNCGGELEADDEDED